MGIRFGERECCIHDQEEIMVAENCDDVAGKGLL